MRRSNRLFNLIEILSDHALHRAQDLAKAQDISLRTLYRDIERLRAAGMDITGTRGAGYRLAQAVTLPPLTLTDAEIEALQFALAIALQTNDPQLRQDAETLTAKIDAALPEKTLPGDAAWAQIENPFADAARGLRHLPTLRAAIRAKQKLQIDYHNTSGPVETHIVQPHRLDHQARSWVITGLSETTGTPHSFRVDLIETARALPQLFV